MEADGVVAETRPGAEIVSDSSPVPMRLERQTLRERAAEFNTGGFVSGPHHRPL